MDRLQPSRFVVEGGKFHLAEALFNKFKFKIRCPHCPGTPREAGFIKDQAGKGGLGGQQRRQWACQRSNSRSSNLPRCGRVSCTEYIDLAIRQLDPGEFADILDRVTQDFPPEQEEYTALQGYINAGTTLSTPLDNHTSPPKKRKAEEELPFPSKTTRHSQAQRRRESSDVSLRSTLQHLEAMIEISKTWQKQYQMLTIFSTSSSPRQPTPSSGTPSWSSPKQGLDSSSPSTHPEHTPPTTSIPDIRIRSDATIPCTYPEDELSSPNALGSPEPSPAKVYVRGVVPRELPSPANIKSSSPTPLPNRSLDPINRARALVQQFRQARADPATATQRRRAIRQQARVENVYSDFQAFLSKQDPSTPELKRSEQR
jgi:hypothetical protein